MEAGGGSKGVLEEQKKDQAAAGEQDDAKKMEEEIEEAKQMRAKEDEDTAKKMEEEELEAKQMQAKEDEDTAKKMEEEELEAKAKAKRMQEKKEGKKAMEEDDAKKIIEEELEETKRMQAKEDVDNAKKMEEEELEEKAKRMQEKKEGKKAMEEEDAKKMEEEEEVLDENAKRREEIKKGKRKLEEEEQWAWDWDWVVDEGQEVDLIKNQQAESSSSSNIKKKSLASKLVSRISRISIDDRIKRRLDKLVSRLSKKKEPPKLEDDDPLTDRLMRLDLQRELRWRVRRIFDNGGNAAPGGFEKALEALHFLKVHIFKDQVVPYLESDSTKPKALPEPSASLVELQKEFQMQLKRILTEEGGDDLNAHEDAFSLLLTIQCLQYSKSRARQHPQDPELRVCSICQIPMTVTIPLREQIALDIPDEYAKDFHIACLNSWLQAPQFIYLHTAGTEPLSCKPIIEKMISSWYNRLEIYDPRKHKSVRDGIETRQPAPTWDEHQLKKREERFNKIIKKISSTNIAKREKGIAELNDIHQNAKAKTEFKGFLCYNPRVIPALLGFLVATATSLNIDVQDDILNAVLHACSDVANKKWIGKDPFIIPHLVIALESELTVRIKVKCAAALITLSDGSSIYYNKVKIGELGAIRQLAKLLEESHREAKKAAALAILSLCVAPENHQKALEANMVDMALRLIMQKIVVGESVMILWLLRNNERAMTELVSHERVEQYLYNVLGNRSNPSNPIQLESLEVACRVLLIQRGLGEDYEICQKIIAVFRKSLGSTDNQRIQDILWWLKFSTNKRNGETNFGNGALSKWWNFIM